jgi:hypothetical protein
MLGNITANSYVTDQGKNVFRKCPRKYLVDSISTDSLIIQEKEDLVGSENTYLTKFQARILVNAR